MTHVGITKILKDLEKEHPPNAQIIIFEDMVTINMNTNLVKLNLEL